jgi:2'-5' RNA ligase
VKPENIHLTLKFLGDVDEARERQLIVRLRALSEAHSPIEVAYGGVGHFGRAGNISAIWIGIGEKTGALARLARDMEAEAAQVGFAPEGKPFSPHITLGRVKEPALLPGWDVVKGSIAPWEGKVVHSWFSLYKSTLTPAGPIYEMQERFGLKNL